MTSSDAWDVVVLGSGIAGLAGALAAHELGLHTLYQIGTGGVGFLHARTDISPAKAELIPAEVDIPFCVTDNTAVAEATRWRPRLSDKRHT
jgi:thioredoxin reductase